MTTTTDTKTCTRCGETKPRNEFHKDKTKKDGLHVWCRECRNESDKSYRATEAGKAVNKAKAWKQQSIKITHDEYLALKTKQQDRCACCGVHESELKKALAVDHDHVTGQIRGLLCGNCNRGIGKLGDNLAGLFRGVDYLLASATIGDIESQFESADDLFTEITDDDYEAIVAELLLEQFDEGELTA